MTEVQRLSESEVLVKSDDAGLLRMLEGVVDGNVHTLTLTQQSAGNVTFDGVDFWEGDEE